MQSNWKQLLIQKSTVVVCTNRAFLHISHLLGVLLQKCNLDPTAIISFYESNKTNLDVQVPTAMPCTRGMDTASRAVSHADHTVQRSNHADGRECITIHEDEVLDRYALVNVPSASSSLHFMHDVLLQRDCLWLQAQSSILKTNGQEFITEDSFSKV